MSTAEAAGTCLGLCARAVGDQVVDLVVPYVTQNIQARVVAGSFFKILLCSLTFRGVVLLAVLYLLPTYVGER